jgi:Flp pilus assembly protein TadD
LASALWEQGKREAAITTLSQWLDQYPEDLLTLNALANFYLLDHQFHKARNQFGHITRLSPRSALAHNNLAWLLLQEDRIDTALTHAQKARELAPNDPEIMDTLGMVLFRKGNYRAAERLFEDATDRLPQNLDVQFHLAQASAKSGNREKAKQILIHILNPENSKMPFPSRESAQRLLDELRQQDVSSFD